MRIALTITELDPGGAELCLANLACFLHGRGHEVAVIALGKSPAKGKEKIVSLLQACDIDAQFGGFTSVAELPRATRWLAKRLKEFRPDIVQSMLFHANFITALARAGTDYRHFGGVRVRQPEPLRWWLQRYAVRKMEKVVCVSRDVARHCVEVEKLPERKIEVIPNGIQTPAEISVPLFSQYSLPPDPRILLFVGRLAPQKGVSQLIHEADTLLAPFPEHHLVLIGDGPQHAELLAARENLQCKKRIHLLGWQAAPLGWMKSAEVLLLPAKYEGMPNVVLEAMSVGTPVASFDVDGITELLGKQACGPLQVADPAIPHSLIDVAHRLMRDESLRHECARHNLERVEHYFQLEDQLSLYEELYLRKS